MSWWGSHEVKFFFFSSYCIPFLRFEASTSNSWFSNESPVAFLSANIKYPQIPWPHTYMFYVKHGISIAFWHRLRQICGGFWHDDDCSLLHLDLIGASPWPCLRFSASCWASIGDVVVYFKYTGSLSVSRNCYMFILYYTNVNGLFTIGDDVSVVYKSIGEEQHPMTSTIIQQR